MGSSPQMRGISGNNGSKGCGFGIIPADAGHFQSISRRPASPWDHPRRCGAFPIYPSELRMVGGSSPQMRGISMSHTPRAAGPRIIPADAGHLLLLHGSR